MAAAVAGVVALLLVAGGMVLGAAGGDGEPEASPEPRPVELPRGGRTILPDSRVVAFYGAPQDRRAGRCSA